MSAHKQCKSKNGFQLRSVQPEQITIQKARAIPLQLFEVLENFAQASFCSVQHSDAISSIMAKRLKVRFLLATLTCIYVGHSQLQTPRLRS